MKIEFDHDKSEKNAQDGGPPFSLVASFEFDSAWIVEADRHAYGEGRYRAIGRLKGELAVVVFTIHSEAVHVISLRFASRKERRDYERQDQSEKGEG